MLALLPKKDDGDRIHAAIKGNCASFCGRQALRVLDKDFQYQGPRKHKKTIQQMVMLHLEGGLKGLGSFWTSWTEVRHDLKGTPDEPSVRMLGFLLEDKLKELGKMDVPIGIALDNWRSASAVSEDPVELEKAYKAFADSVEARCTDERDNKKHQKNAAPAVETPTAEPKPKAKAKAKGGKKGGGTGGNSTEKKEKYEGYCNFNKVLCGNWGHPADECFCNPKSKNYKGDDYVKELIKRKQEALQKATATAACTSGVDMRPEAGGGGNENLAAATSSAQSDLSLDSMWAGWLAAKNKVSTPAVREVVVACSWPRVFDSGRDEHLRGQLASDDRVFHAAEIELRTVNGDTRTSEKLPISLSKQLGVADAYYVSGSVDVDSMGRVVSQKRSAFSGIPTTSASRCCLMQTGRVTSLMR